MNPLDLANGLFGFAEKLIQLHKINEWFKVILGLIISASVAFAVAAGGVLAGFSVSKPGVTTGLFIAQAVMAAVASGLVSASAVVLAMARSNPRLKGIQFAWTGQVAEAVDKISVTTEERK